MVFLSYVRYMVRLNSGKFAIFYPSESILILNSSVCRALKIIMNDIKVGEIPWDFKVKNPGFKFCVGDCVGGYHKLVVLDFPGIQSRHIFFECGLKILLAIEPKSQLNQTGYLCERVFHLMNIR